MKKELISMFGAALAGALMMALLLNTVPVIGWACLILAVFTIEVVAKHLNKESETKKLFMACAKIAAFSATFVGIWVLAGYFFSMDLSVILGQFMERTAKEPLTEEQKGILLVMEILFTLFALAVSHKVVYGSHKDRKRIVIVSFILFLGMWACHQTTYGAALKRVVDGKFVKAAEKLENPAQSPQTIAPTRTVTIDLLDGRSPTGLIVKAGQPFVLSSWTVPVAASKDGPLAEGGRAVYTANRGGHLVLWGKGNGQVTITLPNP